MYSWWRRRRLADRSRRQRQAEKALMYVYQAHILMAHGLVSSMDQALLLVGASRRRRRWWRRKETRHGS